MRFLFPLLTLTLLAAPAPESPTTGAILHGALAAGRLAWRLSEPAEAKDVLGAPQAEERGRDGGLEVLTWTYGPETSLVFFREAQGSSPFVLARAKADGTWMGPRPGEPLILRTAADLGKLRSFTGLQGVDASRLDLRQEGDRLGKLPFDSRTKWPARERLPEGFDPAAILEAGRNPGLGVRALHARGIDGRGVEIAVIDQPLLADHEEIAGRVKVAAELDVAGVPPQMHGPAVASLAAGRSCGVAPAAKLHYAAMAMWKTQAGNRLYIQALERLLEMNRTRQAQIRVVSISTGTFRSAADAEAWKLLLARAETAGVLVLTCDLEATGLDYGLLRPLPGGDCDKPGGYSRGSYGKGLLVPGDGRTYASQEGPAVFSFSPRGGMSWGAPWLAGLAALGFQVNPSLTPARVRAYLVRSAAEMAYGKVVDPAAFIQLCQTDPDSPHAVKSN